MKKTGRERRRYHRAPLDAEFSVTDGPTDEHGTLFFEARNVSTGGAFLASDFLLELDTHLHVRFTLPGMSPIRTGALVVWISDGEDMEPGLGIQFTTLRPEYLEAIKEYIRTNPEKQDA